MASGGFAHGFPGLDAEARRVRLRRGICALLLAFALALAWDWTRRERGRSPEAFALGPFAPLAAQILALRSEQAFEQGAPELGLERAWSALRLEAGDARDWLALARREALELGSLEREGDAQRRLMWLREALATLSAGQQRAREPGSLARERALLIHAKLLLDPALEASAPRAQWLAQALAALEEAERLGDAAAPSLAAELRAYWTP